MFTIKKPRRMTFLLPLYLILFSFTAIADPVDEFVLSRMKERNIPGAAIAVIKNGQVIKQKGYGFASVEFDVPVTADTVFEIGSVSKQMTAAGIMLLVQDGKIKLDEKISAYLPNTPNSWKDVTVRHLLVHSSGIKSYSSLTGFELSRRHTVQQFIEKLSEHELEYTPGEKNIYSNSGFNLLAYIIQEQSEKPFMDFMRERIFVPFQMNRTGDRDPSYLIKKRANGYEWRSGSLGGRDGSLTDLMGAGAITSTIEDMIKWESALRGNKLLTENSKKESWTQFTFNSGENSIYGLGWRISDVHGQKLIGHTGQTAGFGAAIFRYVDSDITVIALTNLGELGMGSLLATGVAKIYIPAISLRSLKTIKDDSPELTQKLKENLNARLINDPKKDQLTAALFRSVTTARAKIVNERLSKFGEVKKMELVSSERSDGTLVNRYRVENGDRLFLWKFTIDKDNKISEMSLEEEE